MTGDIEEIESGASCVEVRMTKLGNGVFATRKIKKHVVLGEIGGRVHDDPNYSSDYCMDLGGDFSLEPDPPFRFLNHSCEPNAELVQFVDDDEESCLRMWIQATRKIRKGEEVTIDYSWPANWAIVCLCGSNKCRGWIVDTAELKLIDGKQLNGKQLNGKQSNGKKK